MRARIGRFGLRVLKGFICLRGGVYNENDNENEKI